MQLFSNDVVMGKARIEVRLKEVEEKMEEKYRQKRVHVYNSL